MSEPARGGTTPHTPRQGHVDASAAVGWIFEMGLLKRSKRTGWWIAGVKDPESIAEHSFRAALIGTALAAAEGADPARVALLCLVHDTQETRTLDLPHIARRYVRTAEPNAITADQVAAGPPVIAQVIQGAVDEYEACDTIEAIVAHDADKLECLVQAVEYRSQGMSTVQPWIDSSRAALKTTAAIQLAEAALAANPLSWQLNPPAG